MGSYNHAILNHEQRKLIRQTGLILFSGRNRPVCPTLEPPFVSCQNRYKKMLCGGGGDEGDLSLQSAVGIKIHEALPALPCTSSWRGVENGNICASFKV